MAIHPGFAPLLEAMRPFVALDWASIDVRELRAFADAPIAQGPPLEMARVEELTLELAGRTLPARLYVPEGIAGNAALTVYFHGGGWMLGTLDTHDASCRALARDAGCAVLSVGYRLAPEHRYPAAVEDAFDALRWAAGHAAELGLDPDRLAVAGDSAGGNLAAAAALMARERGGPALAHQLLIYPVTDADFATPSYLSEGGPGGFLSTAAMRRFWDEYMGGLDPADAPLAAILRREDLAGLPPATVIVAEHDPLRAEGVAYARKLAAAGVETELVHAPGMIHGFFAMTEAVPDARAIAAAAGARLGEALA